ncbi:Sda1, severe depolymerization of actin [Giardia duodenalis]|uniref:Protein SDA1 n=1 Tax=Giardia intestinalis (strain ATCC 50803 / WB clone C6) TaxID=184922 RepID=A8BNX5_GIAIC|nr:Sda1, severe depolymerization of actin [Giardia intestinalis]KAE8304664.1 Sda1, severe depolymerization of actin [Giardia intestinalis]|eukprot:XP_001705817.1 Sda1, severe depolymerization of actin [Giardia lamblia ATCC 50803]
MLLVDLASKACRDPTNYAEEVQKQLLVLRSQLELIQSSSSLTSEEEFVDLLNFTARLSGIAQYNAIYSSLIPILITFTESSALLLSPPLRQTLVQTLILFVKRGVLSLTDTNLLSLYCGLLRIHDKPIRQLVYSHLLNACIKLFKAGKTGASQKILSFFNMKMRDGNALLAFKLTQLCCDLYSKHAWENERTMSVILDSLLNSNDKRISLLVLHFLLLENTAAAKDSDEEEDDQGVTKDEKKEALKAKIRHLRAVSSFAGNQTKTHKTLAKAQKSLKNLMDENNEEKELTYAGSRHPYDNIRDPYVFIEKLCHKYLGRNTSFQLKLLTFEVTSKIIAHHSLEIQNYYRYYMKYLKPQQKDVIKILEYLVSSVHPAIFDEEVFAVMKVIAHEFIHSGSTDYIMTVGLNAIAEMAKRNPNALIANPSACELLNELASYSKEAVVARSYQNSKCKTTSKTRRGVMTAARCLLQFYREQAPDKLEARFQNRDSAQVVRQLKAIERLAQKGQVTEDEGEEDDGDDHGAEEMEELEELEELEDLEELEEFEELEDIEEFEETSSRDKTGTTQLMGNQKAVPKFGVPLSNKKIDSSDFSRRNIAKLLKETYSDDEGEEVAPSKHQLKKMKLERNKMGHILVNCKKRGLPIPECYFTRINELFGPIDEYGNPKEQDSEEEEDEGQNIDGDAIEPESGEPGKCIRIIRGKRGKKRAILVDAESADRSEADSSAGENDSNVPLQSRRLLTDEELARISEYVTPARMNEVDLESFLPRKKLTRAEKTVLAHSGRSANDHKGSRWAESIARKLESNKSLSNIQKQKTTKNMLMLLHSQRVRNKRARSGAEKDRIARSHTRNQKLGISKKATARRN